MPAPRSRPVVKKPAPVEEGFLVVGGRRLAYVVKRSLKRRRTFGFVVDGGADGNGRLVFTAPRWVRLEQMLEFAKGKETFIAKRLAELRQKEAVAAEKELRKQDLEGRFCELPEEWFRKAARRIFAREVAFWAAKVGVTVAKIRVTGGRGVWGSCNANGEINLTWRLMLVPAELREYVVIHELCHRVHMNHGVRFWRLVERFCPEYEAKRKRLNALGAEIG